MKNDMPRMLKIKRVIQENSAVKTFVFEHRLNSKPGQFVMVWLPGTDEKPMSISNDIGHEFWLTICGVGKFSDAAIKLDKGDMLGIRGPYGTSYALEGRNIALVGGGYGTGPMAYLAEQAEKKGIKFHNIVGARSMDKLLFHKRVKNTSVCTDDGSAGKKGKVTDILRELLKKEKLDKIFTCGPEMMMYHVVKTAGDIPCEISMERYMKCGIGICGSCCVDTTGDRMCVEGPVVSSEYLKNIPEFGKYHRDASGKRVEY